MSDEQVQATTEPRADVVQDRSFWDKFHNPYDFVRGSLCENNGKPSSTRLHMFSYGCLGIVYGLSSLLQTQLPSRS